MVSQIQEWRELHNKINKLPDNQQQVLTQEQSNA